MSSIYPHIANATGELDGHVKLIGSAIGEVQPIVERELKANAIDIIFVSAPFLAIPEYGIGGNSPGPNHVYVSFDPKSKKITKEGLVETLLHEIHHCMRWRDPGYGETLGEAMISEGMACLYEEEYSGKPPIYATVDISTKEREHAKKLINDSSYDHSEWFFGTKNIPRWFGYTYGYQLCKEYAVKHKTNSKDMINQSAKEILGN